MKKLLFVMFVGFGVAMFVKSGNVTVTPDRQIQVAGYQVPLPGAVQNSLLLAMVLDRLPEAPRPAGSPAAPVRPAMPIVSSAYGSFNPNTAGSPSATRAGTSAGADGFSAASKALRGQQ
jgi:hypothetical protein